VSGRLLPGADRPWSGGEVCAWATCVLAPNPSPWTLDGTNTWVLTSGEHAVVVDPGPDDPAHLDAIVGAVGDRRLVATLLTHGHADHSAGAAPFHARTGVEVRALDPQHRYGSAGLDDGDVIGFGDREIRVVHTPGHSADSLCFAVHDVLLTGDTVLGRGTTAIIWPEGRLDDYLRSLRRIADEFAGVSQLLPGHGPSLDDPAGVIGGYLEHREERLNEVRTAIANGATTLDAILESVYRDIPPGVRPAAALSLRAQLVYLAEVEGIPKELLSEPAAPGG
jgi:glyoxylase-like metal-dependent hydrolase (beta-lactamase superfamily II)